MQRRAVTPWRRQISRLKPGRDVLLINSFIAEPAQLVVTGEDVSHYLIVKFTKLLIAQNSKLNWTGDGHGHHFRMMRM